MIPHQNLKYNAKFYIKGIILGYFKGVILISYEVSKAEKEELKQPRTKLKSRIKTHNKIV